MQVQQWIHALSGWRATAAVDMMVEGLIACVKHSADFRDDVYNIISIHEGKAKMLQFRSTSILKPGEEVVAEIKDNILFNIKIGTVIVDPYMEAIEKTIKEIIRNDVVKYGIDKVDAATSAMSNNLRDAAGVLSRKLLSGSPIIIRFHNDADGACGAYSLYLHLQELFKTSFFEGKPKIIWRMHRGVSYNSADAQNDLLITSSYDSIEKPLLVVIDFGTSEESNLGLEVIGNKFDIIWLDHHPVDFAYKVCNISNYINPWNFGADSEYTAGFLASKFGDCISKCDCSCIEDASFIGDYSSYAKRTKCGEEMALIMDLITSDKTIAFGIRGDITPAEIATVFDDDSKKNELAAFAKSRMFEALDLGMSNTKKYNTDEAKIYSLNFNDVRDAESTDRYPMPGRFASKMLERIESETNKPAVLILYFGRFISIRISSSISTKINLADIIKKLKEENGNIDSGGGHANAASIKMINEMGRDEILTALIAKIKMSFSKK
jgi:RecJ-like exonuclease